MSVTLSPSCTLAASTSLSESVAICEFEGGGLAMFYASRTMAHGNDTGSEVIGAAGSLAIGRNPMAKSHHHEASFKTLHDAVFTVHW